MLCIACQKIRPSHHNKYGEYCIIRHHHSVEAIVQSAKEGCEICSLFLPYVEHYLTHKGEYAADLIRSVINCPFFTTYDPFDIESTADYQADPGSSIYRDCGGYFQYCPINIFDPNSESIARLTKARIQEENPEPIYNALYRSFPCSNDQFRNHDIFQWLFRQQDIMTDSDQVWIVGENEPRHESNRAGLREPGQVFTLYVGSIPVNRNRKYCLEGQEFSTPQQMALTLPGLWNWPCIPLRLDESRRHHSKFEFCHTPGGVYLKTWQDIVAQPIQAHACSPLVFARIKDWQAECSKNHILCQNHNSTVLPLRVIDVRSPNQTHDVHLVTPHNSTGSIGGKYAILSHCWGKALPKSVVLTSRNVSSMHDKIEWKNLPTSFQDAIIVTRSLGIQYLWIDALCIIQDSQDDWATEASKMALYYSGSEICIAASLADNAQHGILHSRPKQCLSVPLEGMAKGLAVRAVTDNAITILERYLEVVHSALAWRPPLAVQPLSKRAWTLQERLFATRTVHFTKQQVIWQCKTCLLGEDGQIGEDLTASYHKSYSTYSFDIGLRPLAGPIAGANINEERLDEDSIYYSVSLDIALHVVGWYELLGYFSRRSLTYATDQLPAISALAGEVHKLTSARYLAGLWAKDGDIPIRSLLWHSSKPNTLARNGSPSWSWSAVLGPIEHPSTSLVRFDHPGPSIHWKPVKGKPSTSTLDISFEHKNSTLEILEADVQLAHPSAPFGQVVGGSNTYLRIKGLIHPYTGGKDYYDFAAESVDPNWESLKLTEFWDTIEPVIQNGPGSSYLLLYGAEFQYSGDGHRAPGMPSDDSRQFLILNVLDNDGEYGTRDGSERAQDFSKSSLLRCKRVGLVKLVPRDEYKQTMGLCNSACAYIEKNGWIRKEMILV